MPLQRVNGADLYVSAAGSGTPALFIHGMCGSADVWAGQVSLLSDVLRCVSYDRRGHTRSSLSEGADGKPVERSVELHADDAAALVRELQLAPCLLVASSGGARVGLDVLRRYPELVRAAVLSEPPVFGLDPEQGGRQVMAELQPRIEEALHAGNPRAAVDAFFEYMCPGLWRALDESAREPYRANHVELVGDLEMPPYTVSLEELAQISIPTTVVSGSESHPVLRRVARVIAEAMPRARLAEIEGVGHVTYAEAPSAFAAIARERAST